MTHDPVRQELITLLTEHDYNMTNGKEILADVLLKRYPQIANSSEKCINRMARQIARLQTKTGIR